MRRPAGLSCQGVAVQRGAGADPAGTRPSAGPRRSLGRSNVRVCTATSRTSVAARQRRLLTRVAARAAQPGGVLRAHERGGRAAHAQSGRRGRGRPARGHPPPARRHDHAGRRHDRVRARPLRGAPARGCGRPGTVTSALQCVFVSHATGGHAEGMHMRETFLLLLAPASMLVCGGGGGGGGGGGHVQPCLQSAVSRGPMLVHGL